MDMFKEYGITKEEIYDMLDYFNIIYLYDYFETRNITDELYDIISDIDDERIESIYSTDDIITIIETLKAIEKDGYRMEDFTK